jgi:hypothetical protein
MKIKIDEEFGTVTFEKPPIFMEYNFRTKRYNIFGPATACEIIEFLAVVEELTKEEDT